MRTLIIAEAGVNHNGCIDLAKKLIEVAASAGADIVKFQTFKASKLASQAAKKALYQQINQSNDTDDTQFDMLKKLELSVDDHHVLIEHCKKYSIEFWSTAFDLDSISLLQSLNIHRWKIPSGEITNLPYLQKLGSLGEEIILSTGMCTVQEIEETIKILEASGTSKEKITILHCNTEYPTPYKDVNLLAMLELKKRFQTRVGYSDHTSGIDIPVAAVALGAEVIEKHFTLDKNMLGPDHKASLDPTELHAMISSIRNIELAMGDGIKQPSESERKNIVIARKSIHLSRDKKKGNVLSTGDLIMKRPGDGISPMQMNKVIGMTLVKDLKADYKLSFDDLV